MATIAERVEQFFYTHAHPVLHHKRDLMEMIREGEEKYLRRIAELENDLAISEMSKVLDANDRMTDEGAPDDEKTADIEVNLEDKDKDYEFY